MPDPPDTLLDRYLAGELSGPEQRQLARAALDDPELFDVLAVTAAVKATVAKSELPRVDRGASVRRFRETHRTLTWTGVAAAAAAVIALVMVHRSPSGIRTPAPASSASSSAPAVGASAVPDSTRAALHPVILTARLDELAGAPTGEFRTAGANSRPPRSEGVVVSVDDQEVAVDLGSLDGLAKGSELQVFRGRADAIAAGRLTIATVFREHSRGQATPAGALQAGDRVEIAPAVHLAALTEQVAARMAAGKTSAALTLAERAVSSSRLPGVSPGGRRRALSQLGTLEHRTGALEDATRHLRSAVDDIDAAPAATAEERAEILNELGAVLIERGDYLEAERTLRGAQPHATGAAGAHVSNNLAALAALRGDRVLAESMYRSALAVAGNSPELESDRRAIEKNLEGLRAPR